MAPAIKPSNFKNVKRPVRVKKCALQNIDMWQSQMPLIISTLFSYVWYCVLPMVYEEL